MGRKNFNPPTKIELEYLYKDKKLSISKTAKKLKIGATTVRRYMYKFGIIPRNPGGPANIPIELKGKLLEIIEGHLLGDGCISKPHTVNCHFNLKSQHYNYAKIVGQDLKKFKPNIIKTINKNKNKSFIYHFLYTKHLISSDFRKKWYPNGKKIIPKDLKLTPIICLYWYLDDGSLDKKDGGILLNTCQFTEENLRKTVIPQLEQILDSGEDTIKIHFDRQYTRIFISKRFVNIFLEYIGGKSPIKEFNYKFETMPCKRKFWSKKDIKFLKENFDKSNNYLVMKLERNGNSIRAAKRRIRKGIY